MLLIQLGFLTITTSLLVILSPALESQPVSTTDISLRPDFASTKWWPWWTFNVHFQRSWCTKHLVDHIDESILGTTIIGNGHCHSWADEWPFNMYMILSTRGQCGDENWGEYGTCRLSLFSDRECIDAVGVLEDVSSRTEKGDEC